MTAQSVMQASVCLNRFVAWTLHCLKVRGQSRPDEVRISMHTTTAQVPDVDPVA